jgi:hypothetical protein
MGALLRPRVLPSYEHLFHLVPTKYSFFHFTAYKSRSIVFNAHFLTFALQFSHKIFIEIFPKCFRW